MFKLKEMATARSGDKGNDVNIGVIAKDAQAYALLESFLTEEVVKSYFVKPSKVIRYALPNLLAFNFILKDVLDGGGSLSLRMDSQGKAYGQALLEMTWN